MIRTRVVDAVARALHDRYEPERAVTLIGRLIEKAVFMGRSEEALFWALVFANYRGEPLDAATQAQLNQVRTYIVDDA